MKTTSNRKFFLPALAGIALFGGASSLAAAVLEEIVVTAEKREASIQDTAISITAYTGAELANLEVRELQGLSAQTPSMAFSRAGGEAQIYLRGVGNNTFGIGVDPRRRLAPGWRLFGTGANGPRPVHGC